MDKKKSLKADLNKAITKLGPINPSKTVTLDFSKKSSSEFNELLKLKIQARKNSAY